MKEVVKEEKPLVFLVRTMLSIEKKRVATQVRLSHLRRNGTADDQETDALLKKLKELEHYVDRRIALIIRKHPAYKWFSRVKGVGDENIAKIVGLVDISKANTISSLWKFAGLHVVDGHAPHKPQKGEKAEFNIELRAMCWRLGGSLLKAGIRYFCASCGTQRPPLKDDAQDELPVCQKCGGVDFKPIPQSKFAEYYLSQKDRIIQKIQNSGFRIVPAAFLPRDKNKKKFEPPGVISEGHVHNMALRKMIKLFLACLWLVWRQAEGLPTRDPYPLANLGHTTKIDPWEMIDE